MSRGAEAATRLGCPIVECCECSTTLRFVDSVTVETHASDGWRASLCSLACATAYADGRWGYLSCFRVRVFDGRFELVQIGSRQPSASDPWNWTDTGNARWIEENTARLRAAGEIS